VNRHATRLPTGAGCRADHDRLARQFSIVMSLGRRWETVWASSPISTRRSASCGELQGGTWSVPLRNHLATALHNRGAAKEEGGDLPSAIADLGRRDPPQGGRLRRGMVRAVAQVSGEVIIRSLSREERGRRSIRSETDIASCLAIREELVAALGPRCPSAYTAVLDALSSSESSMRHSARPFRGRLAMLLKGARGLWERSSLQEPLMIELTADERNLPRVTALCRIYQGPDVSLIRPADICFGGHLLCKFAQAS
jgi:hypothetical protein